MIEFILAELIPRLLLQMSFLRCHKFVSDRNLLDAEKVLESLTAEIRGVSDPIVASYLRMYLVRTAHQGAVFDHFAIRRLSLLHDLLSVFFSTSPQLASKIGRTNYKVSIAILFLNNK